MAHSTPATFHAYKTETYQCFTPAKLSILGPIIRLRSGACVFKYCNTYVKCESVKCKVAWLGTWIPLHWSHSALVTGGHHQLARSDQTNQGQQYPSRVRTLHRKQQPL